VVVAVFEINVLSFSLHITSSS